MHVTEKCIRKVTNFFLNITKWETEFLLCKLVYMLMHCIKTYLTVVTVQA